MNFLVILYHFDTMVDKLLEKTRGNLFSFNTLGKLAELSNTEQIRLAFNNKKMSDVIETKDPHDLSEPLTGAFFDILVEVYQLYLIEDGLISEDLAMRSLNDENQYDPNDPVQIEIQEEFNSAYIGNEIKFKEKLLDARDYLGKLLSKLWKNITPNDFSYSNVLEKIIQNENRNNYVYIIKGCFGWREIYLNKFMKPRKLIKK